MILIVDDDPCIVASLALLLKQAGYATNSAASPAEAVAAVAAGGIDLVLQDMNFSRQTSGEEGLRLLSEIRQRAPRLPVILITAWGSIPLAVRGIRAGATDFITKPWTQPQLLHSVRTALGLAAVGTGDTAPIPSGRAEIDSRYDFAGVVGEDPAFLRVLDIVGRVSGTDASVLITGESGTGKEVIASAVHRISPRRDGPFVRVNLGGIPPTLFESEMFGHVRGAFTDAHQSRKGRFELADRGTIFLDEIGDLDPGSQVKLLRVLQDRTFEPVGCSTPRTVDVRVVSATNRPIADLVSRGEFRQDLLYRLNLITVHIPPLRERPGDIPLLAQHFAGSLGSTYRRADLTISPAALEWLRGLEWPGNVRQLRQLIERTVIMTGHSGLDVADFARTLEMEGATGRRSPLPDVGSITLEELEKAMISKALKHHAGNISRAAEALGMSRAALYRRCEKYGIET